MSQDSLVAGMFESEEPGRPDRVEARLDLLQALQELAKSARRDDEARRAIPFQKIAHRG